MQSVLIAGASRGFGRALLDEYINRGWTVFPLLRDTQIALELKAANCHPIVADVTSEDCGNIIQQTLREHSATLHLLINNAGNIRKKRGLQECTPEALRDHFEVHCVGAFRVAKAALSFLAKAEQATIVNITSRWGSITSVADRKHRLIYSYQIAKAAQNMLTACLDQELLERGIRVLAMHPGRLLTSAAAPDADIAPEEAARKLVAWIGQVDRAAPCQMYDLMNDSIIEW